MENQEENETTTAETTSTDELATVRAEVEQLRTDLAAARAEQAAGIGAARDALRAANPHIPAILIDGGSVIELQDSVAKATSIAEQFKTLAGTNGHSPAPVPPKVPAGGVTTPRVDTTGMTPAQQIRAGLQARIS